MTAERLLVGFTPPPRFATGSATDRERLEAAAADAIDRYARSESRHVSAWSVRAVRLDQWLATATMRPIGPTRILRELNWFSAAIGLGHLPELTALLGPATLVDGDGLRRLGREVEQAMTRLDRSPLSGVCVADDRASTVTTLALGPLELAGDRASSIGIDERGLVITIEHAPYVVRSATMQRTDPFHYQLELATPFHRPGATRQLAGRTATALHRLFPGGAVIRSTREPAVAIFDHFIQRLRERLRTANQIDQPLLIVSTDIGGPL